MVKKFLAVLILALALFGFSACGESASRKADEIESIKIESVDYFGGATCVKVYDFVGAVLTIENKYPYAEENNSVRNCSLKPERYEKFINDLNDCGFFKLNELYYEEACDGGETTITVTFKDKTTFKTKTVNSSNGIENEISEAFKYLTEGLEI